MQEKKGKKTFVMWIMWELVCNYVLVHVIVFCYWHATFHLSISWYPCMWTYICTCVCVCLFVDEQNSAFQSWLCLTQTLSYFPLKVSSVYLVVDWEKERERVSVYVCVCVRERERERQRERECQTLNDPSREVLLCVCSAEARTGKHGEISYLSQ